MSLSLSVGANPKLSILAAVFLSAAITVVIPFIPLPGTPFGLFDTVPIYNPLDWGIVVAASISGLFILPEVFYGRKIWKWK